MKLKHFFPAILLGALASLSAQSADPFEALSLRALQARDYTPATITVNRLVAENDFSFVYNFTYVTMGKTVSGRFRVPKLPPEAMKGMVLMFRGHQNERGYYTGKGTENIGNNYLRHGYGVIAPDFLGYAASDPTPEPAEAHQLYSAVNAVELYLAFAEGPRVSWGASIPARARARLPSRFPKIALWGHSNGGQVAIHLLEIIQKPLPTILWAPVTLPYPDNVANYQKPNAQWAALFKEVRNEAAYSL
jgi:pimeloyl-ACP methyl ester carboxylesterase